MGGDLIRYDLSVQRKQTKKARVVWLGLAMLFCIPWEYASAVPIKTEVYTENVYLGRENAVQSSLRVRAHGELGVPNLLPFLQVGNEFLTGSLKDIAVDALGSYAYAGPGLRYNLAPFAFIQELRFRQFYRTRPPDPIYSQQLVDVRSLVVFGMWKEVPVQDELKISLFAEPYAEGVFTTADRDNIVLAAYVRLGSRWRAFDKASVDVFVEPFVTLDRVRHFFNNRADVKPSLRFRYGSPDLNVSLTASYLFNRYFARGDFENNPFKDINSGFRFLAVLGATL